MHVLMIETSSVAGGETAAALAAGGHRVHTCQAESVDICCRALMGEPCPLDSHLVAAVVAPDDKTGSGSGSTDYGITCALRRGIPFVLVAGSGHKGVHPMSSWVTRRVPPASLAETITALGYGPQSELSVVARHAVRQVLDSLGSSDRGAHGEGASVYRSGQGLRVHVDLRSGVTDDVRQRCAVAVASALRQFDPCSTDIDVTLT